jgi:hypothetical protein
MVDGTLVFGTVAGDGLELDCGAAAQGAGATTLGVADAAAQPLATGTLAVATAVVVVVVGAEQSAFLRESEPRPANSGVPQGTQVWFETRERCLLIKSEPQFGAQWSAPVERLAVNSNVVQVMMGKLPTGDISLDCATAAMSFSIPSTKPELEFRTELRDSQEFSHSTALLCGENRS